MTRTILFDTETTGLIENRLRTLDRQPEVIEFYGCVADLDTGEVKEELDTLVKPANYPMSPDTIKKTKTKISNEMLADAASFKDHADRIKAFLESADMIIAHNATFDREMMDIEFSRIGQAIKWPMIVCTIEQTMHLRGFRLSLTNLHLQLFEQGFDNAHRAKDDVMALLRCACKLRAEDVI